MSKFKPVTESDIESWLHCQLCLKELPQGTSPHQYVTLCAGITKGGQIAFFCKRHEVLVAAMSLLNPPNPGCAMCDCGDPECPAGPGGSSVKGRLSSKLKPAVKLGKIVSTKAVSAFVGDNEELIRFMHECMERHRHGDGGDLDEDDALLNLSAVLSGDQRVVSVYKREGLPEGRIYIITEADRSVTTYLFPSDY